MVRSQRNKIRVSQRNRLLGCSAIAVALMAGSAMLSTHSAAADTLVYTGATNGNWDTTSTDLNWNDTTTSTNGVAYTDGSAVQFTGGATNLALTVGTGTGVSPASVDFMAGAGSYGLTNFTGDVSGITGATSLNLDAGYTGTVTLKSADTFTGGTNLNGGTLISGTNPGTGTISINGGTLGDSGVITNNLYVAAGNTGNIVMEPTNNYDTLGGNALNTGTLTGGGTLNLNAFYVRNNIGGDWSAFTGTVNITASRNGTDLGFNGFEDSRAAGNANGNGGFYLNNGTLNLNGTATDSLTFSYQNEQNKSTLNGVNAVIGALTGTQYSTLGGYSYGGPPTHALNYVIGTANTSTTFAGKLAGVGGQVNLYKVGSGSLTLTGADNFEGITEVNGGSLVVDGALGVTVTPAGTTGITVDAAGTKATAMASGLAFAAGAGGTLAGNGTLGNSAFPITVTNNGIIAPGDPAVSSTGSLTVIGNVTSNGGLNINVGPSSASSLLAITGNLTLGTSSALNLTTLTGGFDGSVYTIASFTGTLSGTFGTVSGLGAGYAVNYNANSITLSEAATPEPATLGLFGIGFAGLLLAGRRRSRVLA